VSNRAAKTLILAAPVTPINDAKGAKALVKAIKSINPYHQNAKEQ
jgi:hypothetical protein